MKYTKIILTGIILATILISACQKYEVVPYERKIKYIIENDEDTTLFEYDNKNRLIKTSKFLKKYEYNDTLEKYDTTYFQIVNTYKYNTNKIIVKRLIEDTLNWQAAYLCNEQGYVETVLDENDNPVSEYQYDENGFLIKESVIKNSRTIVSIEYIIENQNVHKKIKYDIYDNEIERITEYSYNRKINNTFNFFKTGLQFFGRHTNNIMLESIDNVFGKDYMNYKFDNNNHVTQIDLKLENQTVSYYKIKIIYYD